MIKSVCSHPRRLTNNTQHTPPGTPPPQRHTLQVPLHMRLARRHSAKRRGEGGAPAGDASRAQHKRLLLVPPPGRPTAASTTRLCGRLVSTWRLSAARGGGFQPLGGSLRRCGCFVWVLAVAGRPVFASHVIFLCHRLGAGAALGVRRHGRGKVCVLTTQCERSFRPTDARRHPSPVT